MASESEGGVKLPEYEEFSQSKRLVQKIKDDPYVPIGIAGMLGAVGWGAYTYKKRGSMSPSVFLMQLRVRSQGMIVGAITIGVAYTLLRDYVFTTEKQEEHGAKTANSDI